MRLSRSAGGVLAAVLVAVAAGCSARSLDVDAGPRTPDGDWGGDELLSDFEIARGARINPVGNPPRNGVWYVYNDASPTCFQPPLAGAGFQQPSAPPQPGPGPSGSLALHATWSGCSVWGAGIGADMNLHETDAGSTRRPYDLTPYRGVTFWAMATPGSDPNLRFKIVMRAETRIQDGGSCDENFIGVNKCSDSWGQLFSLPAAGNWRQITVLFSDATQFRQEGWGATFAWDPADVLGVQIQSRAAEFDQPFDFWIDDVYLIK